MPPMRKPFVSPTASAAGDTMMPGMPMPPQAGVAGAQPQMPMGGKPQGDPLQDSMQASSAAAATPGAPGGMPGAASPGGPTAPMNIAQMLQSRMGDKSAAPQQPQKAPMGDGMPAWGDQGTRAGGVEGAPGQMGAAMGGPKRVPFALDALAPQGAIADGAMPGASEFGTQMGGDNSSAIMMKLLRTLGKA